MGRAPRPLKVPRHRVGVILSLLAQLFAAATKPCAFGLRVVAAAGLL